jgi:3-hydroxyacyl-CoA dehydrogenase
MPYQLRDGVAVITIDNPPVNAIEPRVLDALNAALAQGAADPRVRAIVLVGAGRTFVAGADINLFKTISTRAESLALTGLLHTRLRQIEDAPKAVVAAIHGAALGGGLELAMACHARVAVADATVGQPEVSLGLIPGAGGTQRLPRLCGASMALDMCTEGRPVSAPDALAAGLLDRLVNGDREALIEAAAAFAIEQATGDIQRTRDRAAAPADLEAALLTVESRRGALDPLAINQAPAAALHAIEAAYMLPFDAGSALEQELFADCVLSAASRALVYLFFAEREAAKGAARSPTLGVVGPAADLIRGRLLARYSGAARRLADSGVPPSRIDRALGRFGMKVGPVAVPPMAAAFTGAAPPGERPIDRAAGARDQQPAIDDDAIVERVTAALADEGARLIEEGCAARAGDIDVIACYGLGFPRARGGPMYYAEAVRRQRP